MVVSVSNGVVFLEVGEADAEFREMKVKRALTFSLTEEQFEETKKHPIRFISIGFPRVREDTNES